MKLFKNEVGRPSNEILKKRKLFVTSMVLGCLALIAAIVFVFQNNVDGSLSTSIKIKDKKVTYRSKHQCVFPYMPSNCGNVNNSTVKKIQQILGNLKYYDGTPNGKYDDKTFNSVKKFQSAYGLGADGFTGPATLTKISQVWYSKLNALKKLTATRYYEIEYDKNGGSGQLNSSYNNIQIILRNISTQLSSTQLSLPGYKHIGWQPSYNKNIRFDVGENIKITNQKQGKKITMKAVWCKNSDYNGNNSSGTCSKIVLDPPKPQAVFPLGNIPYDSSWYSKDRNGEYIYISRGYCTNCPISISPYSDHRGIDFRAQSGTPVYSVYSGTVVEAQYGGYGNQVAIGHDFNGDGKYEFYSFYGHLTSYSVKAGEYVTAGKQIALSGNTSPDIKNMLAHLHYELRKGGNSRSYGIDPKQYFDAIVEGKWNKYF